MVQRMKAPWLSVIESIWPNRANSPSATGGSITRMARRCANEAIALDSTRVVNSRTAAVFFIFYSKNCRRWVIRVSWYLSRQFITYRANRQGFSGDELTQNVRQDAAVLV